jgi:hypothetical protein
MPRRGTSTNKINISGAIMMASPQEGQKLWKWVAGGPSAEKQPPTIQPVNIYANCQQMMLMMMMNG